jgi:DNA-binding beta-propeller fold protein YncE
MPRPATAQQAANEARRSEPTWAAFFPRIRQPRNRHVPRRDFYRPALQVGWWVARRYASRALNNLRIVTSALCVATLCGCSSAAIDDGGTNDEVSEPVTLTNVYTPTAKAPLSATGLAFNPTVDGELWVMLRQFPSGKPCTMTDDSGCDALVGVAGVVSDATGATPTGVIKQDGNAWHFMRRPTAIAWGDGPLFSSCGEGHTDNYEDDPTTYAGPALWSSDPAIFGVTPKPGQNGTHIDMLHETPYCMGLAHESANIFWAFNGDAGALDRVDFHAPHKVGGEDHSDGEVHRYVTGQLKRVPEVPSHLVYDGTRSLVYVADTGNSRVLSVDPTTAKAGGEIQVWEVIQATGAMDGATVRELVPPGTLQQPSGLAFADDVLYVTDSATSLIHTFDPAGKKLKTFDTALPPGSLAGITIGPDQQMYVANLLTGGVERVERQ